MAVRYNNACWAAPSDVLLFAVLLVTVAEARHQPLKTAQMGACGPNKIVLSAQHPEHAFAFPDEGSEHSIGSFRFGERVHNNASTDPTMNRLPNDVFIPEKGYLYSCHWVIMTDSSHAISAIFDFSSEDGYSLSAEDDFGYIDNCTTKRCLIESSTPALSLEFRTTQLDDGPATRFTAKLYSTSTLAEQQHPLANWWIILVISSTIILIFICISYLFYMKRNILLTRIFRLLSSSDTSSKSAQAKKKAQLTNGSQASTGPIRRQQRTSVCSLHATHFEPMPTIAEEDSEVSECEAAANSYYERNTVKLQQPTSAIRVS